MRTIQTRIVYYMDQMDYFHGLAHCSGDTNFFFSFNLFNVART